MYTIFKDYINEVLNHYNLTIILQVKFGRINDMCVLCDINTKPYPLIEVECCFFIFTLSMELLNETKD